MLVVAPGAVQFHAFQERQRVVDAGLQFQPGLGQVDADVAVRFVVVVVVLLMAVIDVESGFNAGAVSSAGAQGIMQIMPETGKDLELENPFDPSENIDAGVRYLKSLLDTFPDRRLAVAAYNAGPNAVKKYGGIPPYAETQNYVQKVWARLQHYE